MGCGSSAQVSASAAEDAETGSNAPENAEGEAIAVENGDTTVDPLNREGKIRWIEAQNISTGTFQWALKVLTAKKWMTVSWHKAFLLENMINISK